MDPVGIDQWLRWLRAGFTRLPVVLVVPAERLPERWAAAPAFREAPVSVLLESAHAGRYTYLCDRPERVVVGEADRAEIRAPDFAGVTARREGGPLDVLRSLLAERRAPAMAGWPAMTGGLFVLLGYDLVHSWETLPRVAQRDLAVPLYVAVEPRELFVFDHATNTLGVIAWCDVSAVGADDAAALGKRFGEVEASLRAAHARWRMRGAAVEALRGGPVADAAPAASFAAEGFRDAVLRIKDYIAAGDTYQVNLSLRTSRATTRPPAAIYDALRRINPSPYMGLLQTPVFSLVCGSPELLVRLVDGAVSSRPIAGTRRRGAAQAEDADLSVELEASPKERAEHLMLVDLIRNDIGRVAEFGSVHVPEFMAIERYSHVMHLVSQVEGRLAAGRAWDDVLRSMFPGGTITGCPKIRTMQIIEELEPVGRGFYTGALGWISHGGDMELNIIIRSMLVQGGVAHVQAGAGIVADSQPERELDESLRKAQALWAAFEIAERGD